MRQFAISAAMVLAAPGAVSAQMDLPPEITDGFYVTIDEVRANSEEIYRAFAGEGGGPISREQFVTSDIPQDMMPEHDDRELLGSLFDAVDANGDGQLTHQEWEQQINRDLSFADANEDGRITLTELANARENMTFGDAAGMLF